MPGTNKSLYDGIEINPKGDGSLEFKAGVKNDDEQLTDSLLFPEPKPSTDKNPDWTWQGVSSATVSFKEKNGKEIGADKKTSVEITTTDITHESTLTQTTYVATAYFGERKYQDTKVVDTDYVVYLRWPSSWGSSPQDIYCYVYDAKGTTNGMSTVNGTKVHGEKMEKVAPNTTKFFYYPLAAGSFEKPVVEFYNASDKKMATPKVQYVNGELTQDVNALTMFERGDWLYYEASTDTTTARNTWKKYEPGFNGQSMAIVDTGLFGVNFFLEVPIRYEKHISVNMLMKEEDGSEIDPKDVYNLVETSGRRADGRVAVSYPVRAYRMANMIHATMNYKDLNGTEQSPKHEYSIETYYYNMLARADGNTPTYDRLAPLLRALNDYGHYAREGLNNTGKASHMKQAFSDPELPNREELKALMEPYAFKANMASNVDEVRFSLMLHEDTKIKLYIYRPTNAPSRFNKISAKITSANAKDVTMEGPTFDSSVNGYTIFITDISVQELPETYTVEVTADNQVTTIQVSPFSYVYDKAIPAPATASTSAATIAQREKNADLVGSLYNYYLEAKKYLRF